MTIFAGLVLAQQQVDGGRADQAAAAGDEDLGAFDVHGLPAVLHCADDVGRVGQFICG